ncbi:FAD-dependent oxidoreductase [Streptomyces sp. NPDC048182]|uniref:FAD-dependent oxidoreductase n=1 Tax=Streptomyces sp. NPDC048182 TaxID=3365507 RepID=UPI00371BCA76
MDLKGTGDEVDCCISGAGPAGLMLGLLLARCGVRVTVVEKHVDFLRDFRGDTMQRSGMRLLDEIGLGGAFHAIPQRHMERLSFLLDEGEVNAADFTRLPGRKYKFASLVPQWDFLDLLRVTAEKEPGFELVRPAEVTGLLREGGRVAGLRYRDERGEEHEVRAHLTVACDGRHSAIRDQAGLIPVDAQVDVDCWWFQLPRLDTDPEGAGLLRVKGGEVLGLLDRGDFWQCGFFIGKGRDAAHRTQDVSYLRDRIGEFLPWLTDRVAGIDGWDDVKLLDVRLSRLRRWYRDGFLCLGDAAHAMSPAGGVGVNLALMDAAAAARILADPLRERRVGRRELRQVQRRRRLPILVTQQMQRVLHKITLEPPAPGEEEKLPLMPRLMRRVPPLQVLPAALIATGVQQEHAPAGARRD